MQVYVQLQEMNTCYTYKFEKIAAFNAWIWFLDHTSNLNVPHKQL